MVKHLPNLDAARPECKVAAALTIGIGGRPLHALHPAAPTRSSPFIGPKVRLCYTGIGVRAAAMLLGSP
jgi:hypothetical protein